MYVSMGSPYLNPDNFRRHVGGAMKVSRARFGHFECILRFAKLNDWICSRYNYKGPYQCILSTY